jgi:hypothetical protein
VDRSETGSVLTTEDEMEDADRPLIVASVCPKKFSMAIECPEKKKRRQTKATLIG